jgi:GxxExxY protein
MKETAPFQGELPLHAGFAVDRTISSLVDHDTEQNILSTLPTTSLLPYAELVHEEVVRLSEDVHCNFGPNCSESLYQRAVLRALYLENIPVMQERDIFTTHGQGSFFVGRVDLEVAGCCLYEFKSGKINITDHSNQLNRYLRAYANNKEPIRVAALMYFTAKGVFVHRVI